MKNEGILGVLGGMGPQATNTFYQRIIDRTQAESDQDHLQVLIWSDAKIPDRTAGILGGRQEEVFQHLLADAKLLEPLEDGLHGGLPAALDGDGGDPGLVLRLGQNGQQLQGAAQPGGDCRQPSAAPGN